MAAVFLFLAGACGPRALIPPRPAVVPDALAPSEPAAALAVALAPTLYLQADERFQLSRAVAVVHPDSQVIAYHLLWRDDAHGAWIPFTVPTDQEIVWVGHDDSGAPTRIWTYWHGAVLTAPWPGRQVTVDVQWGKHGSLPRGTRLADLPRLQSLGFFYALTWALPDYWFGRLEREGPLCFCRGPARYRQFDHPVMLAPRLDVVVETADPDRALRAVFGESYSRKPAWPWER
ncbi:MAG TPA: hypothetical protein VGE02_14665 [Gemmatimonadales bacterium]